MLFDRTTFTEERDEIVSSRRRKIICSSFCFS